jgi:hypothetical protein
MLTMPQIVQRTPRRWKESAKYVKHVYQKRGWRSEDGRGFLACKSYSTKIWDSDKQKYVANWRSIKSRYVSVIVFLDAKLHVEISCSCPAFRWWGAEEALNKKRAAQIEYSIPEFSKRIRNPKDKTWCCKHLVSLWSLILPEIPKIPRNAKSDDTHAPKVHIPRSILKKQQEERMKKQQQQQQKTTPFVPPKTQPAPNSKGLQSPGMSNWIFGG